MGKVCRGEEGVENTDAGERRFGRQEAELVGSGWEWLEVFRGRLDWRRLGVVWGGWEKPV